jgi:D-tyrosyl-tRNA(Tyr) deacylase
MKAVVQRVKRARVIVGGEVVGDIGAGLLTFLGVAGGDDEADLDGLLGKILKLRIFEDGEGKMNRSLVDVGGGHLIVSQFTLLADTRKGNRPSFMEAAPPEEAERLYQRALEKSREAGIPTAGGRFRAEMQVELVNDGPVTILFDTRSESAQSPAKQS